MHRLLVPLLLLPLAACAVTAPNRAEPVGVPSGWTYGAAAPAPVAQAPWWQRFGDPALDRLVSQVLTVNNELAGASIAVRRAQLQAGLATEALWPELDAGFDARYTRNELATTRSYGASTGISWQVDLWGRLAAARDAARWQALATAQDLEATALSLVGTTVQLYWQLGSLHRRLASQEESLAYARRTRALVQVQYDQGAESLLALREAEQNVYAQEAAITADRQALAETRNALTVLLDGGALAAAEEPQQVPSALPPLQPDLPVAVLANRPDMRAAELRLRALLRDTDAAAAAFYPTLSLTGSASSSSDVSVGRIFHNPVSTLGAALALPFLNWEELRLSRRIAEADFDAAVADFRQSLRQALADVENALSARIQLAAQLDRQQLSLAAAREAETLYETRYRAGAVPLRDWLDAQERRRSAELSLLQVRLDRLNNEVTLYLALGGEPSLAPPPVALAQPGR